MNLIKLRDNILKWAALLALFLAMLKFVVMPWIQAVVRAESNKVLYVIYSEFHDSYFIIPNKQPHHNAKLHRLKEKQKIYRDYIATDYKNGLTTSLED